MIDEWYYAKDNKHYGPVRIETLRDLLRVGELHENTPVQKVGGAYFSLREALGFEVIPPPPLPSPQLTSQPLPPSPPPPQSRAASSPKASCQPVPVKADFGGQFIGVCAGMGAFISVVGLMVIVCIILGWDPPPRSGGATLLGVITVIFGIHGGGWAYRAVLDSRRKSKTKT